MSVKGGSTVYYHLHFCKFFLLVLFKFTLHFLLTFIILHTGATALARAPFGQGTGPIYLDNLFCNSRETRLIDCTHNGIANHNCAHSEDAGLRCQAPTPPGSYIWLPQLQVLYPHFWIVFYHMYLSENAESRVHNNKGVQLPYGFLGNQQWICIVGDRTKTRNGSGNGSKNGSIKLNICSPSGHGKWSLHGSSGDQCWC